MRRWQRWGAGLVSVVLLAAMLAAGAIVLTRAHERSERELVDRFELRADLGARFTESFVKQLVAQERRRAERYLGAPNVERAEFEQVVQSFDFEAAVLLDGEGRLLAVWPRAPKLLGQPVGTRYEHLRAALAGEVGVSGVVPSVAKGEPVVALAVPFVARDGGRRVFSGAFAAGRTPIAAYLRNALPIAGGRLYLVDQRGQVILRSATGSGESAALAGVDPALADGLRSSDSGRFEDDRGAERAFASRAVGDAPWRLVLSVPTATLLAPIRGASSWAPWILFGGFALASIAAVGLFVRLFQHRARLAAVNVELGERNDELRELDRLKDEFVALVSHELRTPLTSVIGYLRLLLRDRAGSLEPEQRRLIGIAERNASRLVRLVGDLLFSAKADAGRLDLDAEPVALNEIVLRCLEGAQPPARERGVHVAHAIEPSVVVEADPERIAQVVDNLVSNAIKFTPEGGRVFVGLHVEGDRAIVEVSDSGIGIPEAEVARLFERFFRASTAVDREIQGSGLGLSVAKTIVEAHGGTIGCTSAERKGSVFRVTLPLAQRHSAAA